MLLSESGIDIGAVDFSAEFGRSVGYYTGFVFEVLVEALGPSSPVGGGGRYDGLLKAVGAPRNVPAVGGAVHTERLLAVVRGGQAMSARLTFAVPSKGRLMEQTAEFLGSRASSCARSATTAATAARSKASTASTSLSSPPPRSSPR